MGIMRAQRKAHVRLAGNRGANFLRKAPTAAFNTASRRSVRSLGGKSGPKATDSRLAIDAMQPMITSSPFPPVHQVAANVRLHDPAQIYRSFCFGLRKSSVCCRFAAHGGIVKWKFFRSVSAKPNILELWKTPMRQSKQYPPRLSTGMKLIVAATKGYTDDVEELLDSGARPDQQYIRSALSRAAGNGHLDTVEAFLERGVACELQDKHGQTALMSAARNGQTEMVASLLDRGAAPDLNDNEGCTALMEAARNGSTESVALLLNRGAAPDLKDTRAHTALMKAAEEGHTDTVAALLDGGASHDLDSGFGWTALTVAARRGHAEVVAALLGRGAAPSPRILMYAAKGGHAKTVAEIL
ncbi:MAG: hypothetical protein GY798_05690, partial [Hyphomicrobiales bacterium]|nr:hypothetical protein [Hyphomicrobiales bacterium]